MRSIHTLAVVCLFLPSAPAAVRSASPAGAALHRADVRSIQFQLNSATALRIAADGSAMTAVQAALDAWNAIPNTTLHFQPLQSTSAGIANDGQNVIAFADTADAIAKVGTNSAVTVPLYAPDGTVSETDIILNPTMIFSTNLAAGTVDLQSLITHELGHALGANHTPVLSATMYWQSKIADNSTANLKPDDAAFAAEAYPGAGAAASYGTLTGQATKDGAPLLGAAVIATDPGTGVTIGGLSSATDGRFSIMAPVGSYAIFAAPLSSLMPVDRMYDSPQNKTSDLVSRSDQNFKAAIAGGTSTPTTFQVTPGASVAVMVLTTGGASSLAITAAGKVAGNGSFRAAFIPIVSVLPGEKLDYIIFGPGLDSGITEDNVKLFGPGASLRKGSLFVDTGKTDPQGRPALRMIIDFDPAVTQGSVSIFITKGSDTVFLPAGILIGNGAALPPVKPVFTSTSVTSAGLNTSPGISPGEIASLYGTNVGPSAPMVPAGLDPVTGGLPTSLAGTVVTFDGIPAPLFLTSKGQINLQVPYEIAGKSSTVVVVQYQGGTSDPITVPVLPSHPALFPRNGLAAAVNQDGTINGPDYPAPKGTYVTLYGTGPGVVSPPVKTGVPVPASPLSFASSASVRIGGQDAPVYQGGVLAPSFLGLLQVAAQVPPNATSGNVSVTLTIGAQTSQALNIVVK